MINFPDAEVMHNLSENYNLEKIMEGIRDRIVKRAKDGYNYMEMPLTDGIRNNLKEIHNALSELGYHIECNVMSEDINNDTFRVSW